jgi:VCBS repeat-containing protein
MDISGRWANPLRRGKENMATRLKGRFSLLLLSFAVVMLIFPAMAFAQDAGGSPSPAPTIQSDKADYSPGETVTLTGSGWQPGESVNINVNDDEGQTWNRNVDVTADDNGQIQDQFQLPDWFVAKYSVKATGANGVVATTTFTDANLKVSGTFVGSTTDSYTLTYQRFSGAACGGTLRSGDTPAPTQTVTTADFTVPPAGQNSAQLTAPATSAGGGAFINWTDSNGNIVPDTVVTGGGHRICADFPPGGTDKTYKANYGAANRAPVTNSQSVATDEDTAKTITLTGSDADGNNLTFAITAGPSNGTLGSIGSVTCTGTAPKNCSADVTYTPNSNFNGSDSFKFQVNDGTVNSNEATVSITVNAVNDAPVATNNSYSVNEDGELDIAAPGVLGNDSDTDSPNLTAVLVDDVAHGTLTLNADGSFTYTPATNYNGPDSFTYKANDGSLDSNVATVSITVNAVNDPPTANAGGPYQVNEGDSVPLDGSGSDPDQGDTLTYDWDLDNNGSFETSGENPSFSAANIDGPATLTVVLRVTDTQGATNTSNATVIVDNVAPTVTLQGPNEVDESATAERLYTFTVSDPGPDDDGAVIDKSCGLKGQIADGSYSYDPQTGEGSFRCIFPDGDATSEVSVKATDKDGGSDADSEKVIIVQISNVNPTIDSVDSQSPINEGSSSTITVNASDPGDPDPLSYSFDCNGDGDYTDAGDKGPQASNSASCSFADDGTYTVNVQVTDGDGGEDTDSTQVTVNNVAPTASNGTFVFNPILGTATAGFDFSDVGFLDTHSASYFTWSGVGDPGNRPASVTEENVAPDATGHASDTRTLNPGCYPNLTVTGTAVDDDGGSSAPLPLYSSNTQTSVHGKAFRPPIMDNERNIAKYGNVVPVKVQLTNSCTGGTDTNVTLYITLAKGVGDEAIEDTNVIAGSVSSADTGSQMRVVDGMYMFNLSTKNLSANTNWTVRVRLGSTTGPVLLQAVLYPKK